MMIVISYTATRFEKIGQVEHQKVTQYDYHANLKREPDLSMREQDFRFFVYLYTYPEMKPNVL